MNADSYLQQIASQINQVGLEAILIGNAAAAVQGVPVPTIGFDFLIRKAPSNITNLKKIAKALDLVIYKPMYPASPRYRLVRDRDCLQLDFCTGLRNYKSLRSRATPFTFGSQQLPVATLEDITINQPSVRPILTSAPPAAAAPNPKHARYPKPPTLKQQFEHMRLALIDTWLALPPERRTNFLRRRIGIASSAL